MPPPVELSVIVLCYRGEERIPKFAEPLRDELEASGALFELILVANYWPDEADRTPEVVDAFASEHSTVQSVSEPKRGGMGWDLRSGLSRATGEYLVYLDGDGQVPAAYALEAYRLLRDSGVPIVKGRRVSRDDGPLRRLTSFSFNALFRMLFGTSGLWDVNGQPKGLTRATYDQLDLRTDDWFTDAEIVLKARDRDLAVSEFPVLFARREVPQSFVGPSTVLEFLVNMARWRIGRHPAQRPVIASRREQPLPIKERI